MTFTIIIPARYDSSRLPGKVLLDIGGKPMLQHVYERAQASEAERIVIATDSEKIAETAGQFARDIRMTARNHPSGSSRAAEIVQQLNLAADEIIVTLQADEPFIPPENIQQVAQNLANIAAPVATLAEKLTDPLELENPHIVKVVCDAQQYALYFSRAAIPHKRADSCTASSTYTYLRHIGLYAYRAGFLTRYTNWPPSPLEQLEQLEQLRILYQGEKIHVALAHVSTPRGVDTAEDLAFVRKVMRESERN